MDDAPPLRQGLRQNLGGLPKRPEATKASPFLQPNQRVRAPELNEIEAQIRTAIRDAVNRPRRKPFAWGGLKGYQHLQAIADGLQQKVGSQTENTSFQQLLKQVERALASTSALAESLQTTHTWLLKIAACLRSPPSSYSHQNLAPVNSQRIEKEMTALLEQFQKRATNHRVLSALYRAVNDRGQLYG